MWSFCVDPALSSSYNTGSSSIGSSVDLQTVQKQTQHFRVHTSQLIKNNMPQVKHKYKNTKTQSGHKYCVPSGVAKQIKHVASACICDL